MRADEQDAPPPRQPLVEQMPADDRAARGDLPWRQMLHADALERLAPEMPPAVVEDAPPLRLDLPGKDHAQIAHGQPVAAAHQRTGDDAEARAPADHRLIGCRAERARHRAIHGVLDPLLQTALTTSRHAMQCARRWPPKS